MKLTPPMGAVCVYIKVALVWVGVLMFLCFLSIPLGVWFFLGMASCTLSKKGLREQFVAQTNGGQYVRCSNTECKYFCSLQDLLS